MKKLLIGLIVVAVISFLSRTAVAEGIILPPGTVITTPDNQSEVLKENKFLIEREDLDYYNALQMKLDASLVAKKQCEKDLDALLKQAPQPSFWDSSWGTITVVGGVSIGISAVFIAGYILGSQ